MTAPASTAAPAAPTPTARATRDALGPVLAWLVARAPVDDDAFAALADAAPDAVARGATDPERLAAALTAAGMPAAALGVVAAALPPREGVWWAWVAVRHAMQVRAERAAAPVPPGERPPVPPSAAERAALAAVERWIAEPNESNRRLAWDAGQAADLSTPAGCACGAVFFTSGSIAAPQSPMHVPAPPGVHVTLAATAVLLAAVAVEPTRIPALVEGAVAQASAVARRLGGWDAAASLARRHFDAQREQHGAAVDAAAPKTAPSA